MSEGGDDVSYEIVLGDCLELLPQLSRDAVVITDPPYGLAVETNYRERKRTALALCNDFAPIVGDDKPFDPAPFLGFRTVVMFGANYFARHLPDTGAWLVWDKLDGLKSRREIGFSDCEFIWASKGGASRILRHRWMGAMKATEQDERRVHPTQKPVSLLKRLISLYTKPGETVFDPYAGSGSCGVAAIQTGRNYIGCEIDPHYHRIAEKRLREAAAQPSLFAL